MAEESRFKQFGYPIITTVAFLLAGSLLYANFGRKPIQEMPDDALSGSPFACESCGWSGMLSARQNAKQQMKGMRVERAKDEKTGNTTGMRVLIMTCPSCNQIACRVAGTCDVCGTIFLKGDCPKCAAPTQEGAQQQGSSSTGSESRPPDPS